MASLAKPPAPPLKKALFMVQTMFWRDRLLKIKLDKQR